MMVVVFVLMMVLFESVKIVCEGVIKPAAAQQDHFLWLKQLFQVFSMLLKGFLDGCPDC